MTGISTRRVKFFLKHFPVCWSMNVSLFIYFLGRASLRQNGVDQEETSIWKLEQVGQKFRDGTESLSRAQGITGG